MKIFDPNSKRLLDNVVLYLSPTEALELGQSAVDLAENPSKHHYHVSDSDYLREITVTVVTSENLNQFDAQSRKIIGDN